MTSTVTTWTTQVMMANDNEVLSNPVGLIAILLLLALLVQKELAQSYGEASARLWQQTLNIAAVPLFLIFGLTMITRLLALFP